MVLNCKRFKNIRRQANIHISVGKQTDAENTKILDDRYCKKFKKYFLHEIINPNAGGQHFRTLITICECSHSGFTQVKSPVRRCEAGPPGRSTENAR